jgi:hypothetical protein
MDGGNNKQVDKQVAVLPAGLQETCRGWKVCQRAPCGMHGSNQKQVLRSSKTGNSETGCSCSPEQSGAFCSGLRNSRNRMQRTCRSMQQMQQTTQRCAVTLTQHSAAPEVHELHHAGAPSVDGCTQLLLLLPPIGRPSQPNSMHKVKTTKTHENTIFWHRMQLSWSTTAQKNKCAVTFT